LYNILAALGICIFAHFVSKNACTKPVKSGKASICKTTLTHTHTMHAIKNTEALVTRKDPSLDNIVCFVPTCFTPFCFNTQCQYTPILMFVSVCHRVILRKLLKSYTGIPSSARILYETSLQNESKAFLNSTVS
jgi:hypothetical protein